MTGVLAQSSRQISRRSRFSYHEKIKKPRRSPVVSKCKYENVGFREYETSVLVAVPSREPDQSQTKEWS